VPTLLVAEYFLDLFVPEAKPNKEKKTLPTSPLKKVLHRPLHWTAEDDTSLKKLVDENFSNWRLIAEAFNTLRKTVDIERRTAETCRERYEMLVPPKEAKAEDDGSETDMDAKDGGLGRIQTDVLRPLNVAESVGDAPKVIRHQLVHRTIKRVALRRSEMLKEKRRFHSGIPLPYSNVPYSGSSSTNRHGTPPIPRSVHQAQVYVSTGIVTKEARTGGAETAARAKKKAGGTTPLPPASCPPARHSYAAPRHGDTWDSRPTSTRTQWSANEWS
jgi:hypothetical protein